MANLRIFISFEFDKDRQAREQSQHRVRNCSLNQAYPDEAWKNKARQAIRECDVVLVLNQSQGGNYMDSGIKAGLRVSEEFLGGFSFMYFSPWC